MAHDSKGDIPTGGGVNLQGRTFMADLNNPFQVIQEVIEEMRAATPLSSVDFHTEATSEKNCHGPIFGWESELGRRNPHPCDHC